MESFSDHEDETELRFNFEKDIDESSACQDSNPPVNRSNKKVLCRYYIRGACWKNEKCDFSHNTSKFNSYKNLPTHMNDENLKIMSGSNNSASRNSQEACVEYYLGFCRAGPLCRKKHVKLPLEEMPQFVPDWYLHLILENAQDVIPPVTDPDIDAIIQEVEKNCRQLDIGLANLKSTSNRSLKLRPFVRNNSLVTEEITKLAETDGIPGLSECNSNSDIRVFMMKSNDINNLQKSVELGVWATGKPNTYILQEAFSNFKHVVLIFSVNESGGMQGYAKMTSLPKADLYPNIWGKFGSRLGENFHVEWICQTFLDFEKIGRLNNSLNNDYPISRSRNGQEIPFDVAAIICSIMYYSPEQNIITQLSKQSEKKPTFKVKNFKIKNRRMRQSNANNEEDDHCYFKKPKSLNDISADDFLETPSVSTVLKSLYVSKNEPEVKNQQNTTVNEPDEIAESTTSSVKVPPIHTLLRNLPQAFKKLQQKF